jgi:hypothetical protein
MALAMEILLLDSMDREVGCTLPVYAVMLAV